VYTGIAQGVLSQKVAMAVLERYTINVKTRKEIWRCATTDGEPPWYKHTWLRLNQYGLDVEHHVSEIMHLLFLGIVKKFINLIMRWAVGSSRGAVLERALDKACCACNKLHLDKLQSHPYTAIGGWVSENYVAFAKLLPWLMEDLGRLEKSGAAYVEPAVPQEKWTRKENEAWLRACGQGPPQSFSSFGDEALAVHVAQLAATGEHTPAVAAVAAVHLQTAARLLWCMLCRCMQREATEQLASDVDRCVKGYLTAVHIVDTALRAGKGTPMCVSAANHMTLLNLADTIRELGPLINYWGGGWSGERILSEVKKLFPRGVVSARNTLQKFHERRASRRDAHAPAVQRKTSARVAGGAAAACGVLKSCEPVSATRLEGGTFAVPVGHFYDKMLPVAPSGLVVVGSAGAVYQSWHPTGAPVMGDSRSGEQWVLLPHPTKPGWFHAVCIDTWLHWDGSAATLPQPFGTAGAADL
jgi:hypothetical protein